MLYGMEEFDDEFGLIKSEQLNMKRVVIAVAIIIVLIIALCIYIFWPKKDSESQQYSQANVNQQEIPVIIENNKEDKEENIQEKDSEVPEKKNELKEGQYTGMHMQIAMHNISTILPVFNENAPALIKDIYGSDEKNVYLTFDDGPSKDITPQILDILRANDVKATFFVLGARVDLYPETLKQEFNEGHYIANHGYSHKYSAIYENKDTVFDEYVRCENSIKQALDNNDYNSYLFRFPGGSSGGVYSKIKNQAKELFDSYGVAYTNWNCLTGDAEGKKTKEECLQKMIDTKATANSNSIILLMHDANDKQQTVDALPEIIQYYKDEGYEFKTFYEIFK